MLKLRYYCQGEGDRDIKKFLCLLEEKHRIPYEVADLSNHGVRNPEMEKEIYEKDFKPRARILKRRTGEAISQLRSRKVGNYFVSIPGTLAIVKDKWVEWYTLGDRRIMDFLGSVSEAGSSLLEQYCEEK